MKKYYPWTIFKNNFQKAKKRAQIGVRMQKKVKKNTISKRVKKSAQNKRGPNPLFLNK